MPNGQKKMLADRLADRSRNNNIHLPDKDRISKGSGNIPNLRLRGATFTHEVKDSYILDLDDLWFWAMGRGEVAIHPVLTGKDFGRRGVLEKKGRSASLYFDNDPKRNALVDYKDERSAVLESDQDFTAEVYGVREDDSFKIYLIDLMFWGDKLTDEGFRERRRNLVDFAQKNLIGSGRFEILDVVWIQSNSELQEAVKWALDRKSVSKALAKTGNGEYPLKTITSQWYEIKKDQELLVQPVNKQLDDISLLAVASLGYRVQNAPINKENPKKIIEEIKTRVLKADEEKQYVLGVVLEPMMIDAHDDIMIPEQIELTAHDYLANHRVIGFRHATEADVVVVESYLAPVDFTIGDELVKKGSWVLGVIIRDHELWLQVQNGEINGFSIGGFARREELG